MVRIKFTRFNLLIQTILGLQILWVVGCATLRGNEGTETQFQENSPQQTGEASRGTAAVTKEAPPSTVHSAEYHFSLAQAYSQDGNPDRAIEEYKLTLSYDPNSALVRTRLASEYVKKGLLSLAMDEVKEAVKLDPKMIDARLILAGLFSTTRQTDLALGEYNAVLKLDPANSEAQIYKSQLLVEDNKVKEAVASLREFLKKNSSAALVWYYLGRAEQHQEHLDEAITAYGKTLAISPNFNPASLALGYIYELKGLNDRAIEVYRDSYENTQDSGAAHRIATLYLKQEKYKESVPYLEAAKSADPENLNIQVKLGLVYMELKDYERAIATFKEILKVSPGVDRIHYYLGSLYEERKQIDPAIAELIQIPPDSKLYEDATLHVAFLYRQKGEGKTAKNHIGQAIEQSPAIASFYIFQASLEEEDQELDSAKSILEKGVERFPEHEKLRYYLGSVYDKLGNYELSLLQMEEILKLNPKNADALNYIGYTWTTKGVNLDRAEEYLKQAMGIRPDNGFIVDSWGWYLFTRGRLNEAVVALEKAARLAPDEATILDHLADVYARLNLREKALIQYSHALRVAKEDGLKKQIEDKLLELRREIADRQEGESRSPASKTSGKNH